MKLYEIEEAILDCVDMETGEILDLEKLESLTLERDKKVEGICLWIKNLKAEYEAVKAEKIALEKRQTALKNKYENLTEFIARYLNGDKFTTGRVSVSYRKSTVIDIEDGAKIPESYLKYKEPEVDKAGLKDAIKNGLELAGVKLIDKQNIQIK